jgi:hypothetical protein
MSFNRMAAIFERMYAGDIEAKRRARLCELGGHSWYCVFAPVDRFSSYLDFSSPLTRAQMHHMKERFHRAPKSARAICGAKTRNGSTCRARVVTRTDGTPARRCRMHGGLSTGPRTAKGRARIAESNRRRARKANKS